MVNATFRDSTGLGLDAGMHYAIVFLSSVTTIVWKRLEFFLAILEGEVVL